MHGKDFSRVIRVAMPALGAVIAVGAQAQSFDLDRDLLRDLVTPVRPPMGVLKAGELPPPKRILTLGLRASASSTTAGDSKRDETPVNVHWQVAAASPWAVRMATSGLGVLRREGQASVGGWSDTQLMALYTAAPTTTLIARYSVPAHGQLGSSEPEQAVQLVHWRTTHQGRQTWTGTVTAAHQSQAAADVSAQLYAAQLYWKLDEGDGRSWNVFLNGSRRQGAASRAGWSGSYVLPVSFSSENAADRWELAFGLGRSKAGTTKTSSVSLYLSKKLTL
jgi:hypothetical protein